LFDFLLYIYNDDKTKSFKLTKKYQCESVFFLCNLFFFIILFTSNCLLSHFLLFSLIHSREKIDAVFLLILFCNIHVILT